MHDDLMTGLYIFIPFLLILLFWLWPYLLHYVIQCVQELKIHSIETVSEVSQNSSMKIVVYGKRKRDHKVKRIKKESTQIIAVESLTAAFKKQNDEVKKHQIKIKLNKLTSILPEKIWDPFYIILYTIVKIWQDSEKHSHWKKSKKLWKLVASQTNN